MSNRFFVTDHVLPVETRSCKSCTNKQAQRKCCHPTRIHSRSAANYCVAMGVAMFTGCVTVEACSQRRPPSTCSRHDRAALLAARYMWPQPTARKCTVAVDQYKLSFSGLIDCDVSKRQRDENDLISVISGFLSDIQTCTFLFADQTEESANSNPRLDWFVVQQDVAAEPSDEPQHPCTTSLIPAGLHKQSIKTVLDSQGVVAAHVKICATQSSPTAHLKLINTARHPTLCLYVQLGVKCAIDLSRGKDEVIHIKGNCSHKRMPCSSFMFFLMSQ